MAVPDVFWMCWKISTGSSAGRGCAEKYAFQRRAVHPVWAVLHRHPVGLVLLDRMLATTPGRAIALSLGSTLTRQLALLSLALGRTRTLQLAVLLGLGDTLTLQSLLALARGNTLTLQRALSLALGRALALPARARRGHHVI